MKFLYHKSKRNRPLMGHSWRAGRCLGHRYLIYGYTRQKVNNTNAFHNNRQNIIRKKKIKAAFINILRFECVKMNFKFSTAKKVKVSQFLSL